MPRGGKKGNRGGGRKSAYQEQLDAQQLYKAFFEEQDVGAIVAKIQSGKFSIFDRAKALGLAGKERVIMGMLNKLVPDLARFDGKVETTSAGDPSTLTPRTKKIIEEFEERMRRELTAKPKK